MKPSALLVLSLLLPQAVPASAADRDCSESVAPWLEQAAQGVETRHGIKVACGLSSGSAQFLQIADGDGSRLGTFATDASLPPAEVAQGLDGMLSIGRDRLKALVAAHEALMEDMDALRLQYHVSAGFPSALRQSARYPENKAQLISLGMPDCSGGRFSSSEPLGRLTVNVSEYLPGRGDYADASIYKKGDLKAAFEADSAVQAAYARRVKANTSDPQCVAQLEKMDSYAAERLRSRLGPAAPKIPSWDDLRQKFGGQSAQ